MKSGENLKIVIAGASGFVGRNIAEFLIEKGFDVYPVLRRRTLEKTGEVLKIYEEKRSRPLIIESFSRERLREEFRRIKPDILINAIGLLKGSERELYEAHVGVVEEILGSLELPRGEEVLYIHISSTGASDMRLGKPVREEEEHCSHIDSLRTYYEKSKCLGEIRVREICGEKGFKYVILRPSIIIGEYNTHREWINILRLSRIGIELDIGTRINILDVKDLAGIVLLLIERRDLANDFYHIASPKDIRISDISRVALRIIGRRGFLRIGMRSLRIASSIARPFLGDIDRRFLEVLLTGDARISSEKFIGKTGYRFRDPMESLERFFTWLKKAMDSLDSH
ncbi:MAG: NAD(P)-dependent oxidoreductase [Sulfolobales archaeon]